MRKIKLNDGSEYSVERCGASDGILWVEISNYENTIIEAATVFGDPEKTRVIEHFAGDNDHVTYDGYTKLWTMTLENKSLTISIKREE